MSTDKVYHYVYRITNIVENKHYYGKRSSVITPKLDLGIKYFSSSTNKEFILDQKINPLHYKYKIVSLYLSAKEAVEKEIILHSKFNVDINPYFYNKAKQTSISFIRSGYKTSEETRRKLSEATKGKQYALGYKHTKEAKIKMSEVHKGNQYCLGYKHTEEHKKKLSEAHKGKRHTEETIQKISGINNSRAKLANVYDCKTDKLIVKNIIINEWATLNNYNSSTLSSTARADRGLSSSARNRHCHKGVYAKYIN